VLVGCILGCSASPRTAHMPQSSTAVAGSNGAAGFSSAGASGGAGSGALSTAGAAADAAMGAGTGGAGANGQAGVTGQVMDAGVIDAGTDGGSVVEPLQKFCGNITSLGKVRSDFSSYWDQITPENEGKWGSVEGTRNQMNWAPLDAVYDYAKQHHIPFKQHNFVWGAQQPGWIAGLSQSEQRAEVEEWIRLFCERYPDTQLIDVVNEPPPHTSPPYMAALGGAGSSGYDWIVQSFKWARQYCPNAILILNDYNIIEYSGDNSHIIDIVKRIQAAGAPIDAVGAQAHAAFQLPTSTVQMYIDAIATQTGLPVYISEYDINLADDAMQQSVMQSQFTMFWNDAHVNGVTLWGYVEGQTWQANTGLMSSAGQKRPAMDWLMQFLGK
jgi:endo-1,4-beta-xylanase